MSPKYEVGTYEEVSEISKPLEVGVYEFEVFSGESRTIRDKKTGADKAGFEWVLKVVNHDDPDKNGTTCFLITPLEGKGRMFLQQLYDGCGVKWEGGEADLPEDLQGRTCFASVEVRTWEGKARHGIKAILPKQ